VRFQVRVKPRARTSSLDENGDGTWTARVRSPPVGGKANAELVGLVSVYFGCPRSAVTIRSGAAGRDKWVEISD
jgi:uncharacterized protein (TIGR00251 family)